MPEPGLELFDPIHDREHHPACPAAREPGRAKGGDPVEELSPQPLLHTDRGRVGNPGPRLLEHGADQNHAGGGACEKDLRPSPATAKDKGEELAEERESGNAGRQRAKPEQHRERDAAPHAGSELPEAEIEIHVAIIGQPDRFANRPTVEPDRHG
ncbi:MAG TPA: hypothetical protein VG848_04465 [Acetobacteraceae bacterium]|nr:hypothetical protein [Acetobacteraceae bacterium]